MFMLAEWLRGWMVMSTLQSTTLLQTEMSCQILHGLAWNFTQAQKQDQEWQQPWCQTPQRMLLITYTAKARYYTQEVVCVQKHWSGIAVTREEWCQIWSSTKLLLAIWKETYSIQSTSSYSMSLDFIRAALMKQGYLVPLPGTPCPLFMLPSFCLACCKLFMPQNFKKKSIKGLKLNFT